MSPHLFNNQLSSINMFIHKEITESGIYNIELYDEDFLDEEPFDKFQIKVFDIPKIGLTFEYVPNNDHSIHPVDSLWDEHWLKQEKVRELNESDENVIPITKRKRTVKPYYG